MANTYKVLGQVAPAAATATTLYTVPAATEAIISTINVCNQTTAASTFRIAVRPNGEALAAKHYLSFDTSIPPNDSIALTLGITVNATDIITVYSGNGYLSFNVFGTEVTA